MKKIASIILTIIFVISIVPMALFSITASAVTEGYYTYTISGGKAKIVDVDENIGELAETPSILGGCPVTSIGYKAFYNCENLVHVLIPSSITKIEEYAFYHTPNLKCVYITDVAAWCNIDFADPYSNPLCYASILYYADGSGKVEKIPEGVTTIKKHSFYSYDKLTDIELPNSLKVIEDGAFSNCGIQSITIPSNVVRIGAKAFMSCNINTIYFNASDCFVHEEAFENCGIVKKVVIGENVKTMSEKAFYSRKHIETVELNAKSCSNLPWFYLCENLKNIIIGDNVTHIPSEAFLNCDAITEVNLPNSIISIGNSAFSNCNGLTRITIPDSVTSIGDSAFSNCGLTNIEVDKKNAIYYSQNNCLIQKETNKLVLGCNNSIIPNSVINIGNSAFSNCKELTKITIPNGVTSLGEYAFSNCTSLTTITLPNSLTSIGNSAFFGCAYIDDVWFNGTKSEKENISIGADNSDLKNATWHYNTCPNEHDYSADCDVTCNSCEWIRTLLVEHTLDNNCDTECNLCDYKRTTTHDFEWVVDKSENCGKTGTKHEECSICHTKRNEGTVIDATGNHKYDNACDTSCNICGETRTITHDFEWVVDKSENCGKTGVKHEECAVCHIKRNEGTVIEATGNHNFEWVVDKSEDCGVDGEKHEECSVCHAKRNEGTVIEATGNHNYEWVIDKENGCTEDGVKHEKCTVCNAKNRENTVINATGHFYDDGSDSTCNVCQHQRQHYTITYNGNGEDGAPTKQTLYEGVVVKLPTIASDYYRLLGWSKTPNGGVDYRIGNSYTVTENVTLYAKWARHCYYCDDIGFKNITENRKVDCWTCDGTGQIERKDTTNRRCLDCGSTSYTYHSVPGNNGMYGWYYECNLCGSKDVSTGYVEKVSCTHCSGIGYKYETYSTTQVCIECNGLGFHKIPQVNAPQPQLASKTSTSVTLVQFDGVDYSMDGETWQESNVFKNLIPEKEYCFFMRYKANGIHTVGSYGARLYVTTNSLFPSTITSSKYTISGKNISKITAGTTVSSLLAGLNEGSYCKVYKGNSVVSGNTAVGTGMVVKIMDGNTVKASYTVIVTGDTNGDGAISVTDMIAIKAHILNKSTLTGVYATAANTNGDSGISITDFIQVKAKILGKGSITAR